MNIYIVAAIVLTLFCFFREKKWPLFLSFIFLFIIVAFRDLSVGTDTQKYALLFEQYRDLGDVSTSANEPFYKLLRHFVILQGWNYETLQFLCSLVVLLPLFFYVAKVSRNPHYSILCFFFLYFFFYSMNITRQYMAMPFALYSFYFISKKDWKRYVICVVVAFLLHYSSILCLMGLIFNFYKPSQKTMILALVITFVIGLTPLGAAIARSMSTVGDFGYDFYVDDSNQFYRESLFSLTRLLLVIYAIGLIYMLENKNNILSILVIGICILNLFSFQPIIGRLAQYFTIIQIVIIPNIASLAKRKETVPALEIASFAYIFVTWSYLFNNNIADPMPWKFGTWEIFV